MLRRARGRRGRRTWGREETGRVYVVRGYGEKELDYGKRKNKERGTRKELEEVKGLKVRLDWKVEGGRWKLKV